MQRMAASGKEGQGREGGKGAQGMTLIDALDTLVVRRREETRRGGGRREGGKAGRDDGGIRQDLHRCPGHSRGEGRRRGHGRGGRGKEEAFTGRTWTLIDALSKGRGGERGGERGGYRDGAWDSHPRYSEWLEYT